MMSVSNMIFLTWYPINCSSTFEIDILCTDKYSNVWYTNETSAYTENVTTSGESVCQNSFVWFEERCWQFSLKSFRTISKLPSEDLVKYISKVSEQPVAFAISKNKSFEFYQYSSLKNRVELVDRAFLKEAETQMTIIFSTSTNSSISIFTMSSLQLFQCEGSEYISLVHFHNNVEDCAHGDDEIRTISPSCADSSVPLIELQCEELHFVSKFGCCYPFNNKHMTHNLKDEEYIKHQVYIFETANHTSSAFSEPKNNSFSKSSHLYTDCKEQELKHMAESYVAVGRECNSTDELFCTFGCSLCFPIHKLCVFELTANGELMYCPSGAHLKNCFQFSCNNMFKCHQHYCIPYR